jgi:hypothetical protein
VVAAVVLLAQCQQLAAEVAVEVPLVLGLKAARQRYQEGTLAHLP